MDKAFVKKVLAVLLGVSLVILVYETVSLIVTAALFDDLQIFENSLNDLEAFIKWSAVALACMLIPALASYVFAFFGKNKLFVLISAALSLIVTICCIAFFCMARVYAMQGFSSTSYAQGASFLSEFIQIAIASALIGAYLLITFLRSVKKKHTETVEVTVAAEVSENEEA
ncbi:MAG: hypothetical protein HFK03_01950 [Clostridia bacterium]|nr:hypothetical protein [Clostridia bacterium]